MSNRTSSQVVFLVCFILLCGASVATSQEDARKISPQPKYEGKLMSNRDQFIEAHLRSAEFSCDYNRVKFGQVVDDLKDRFNIPIFIDDSAREMILDENTPITLKVGGISLMSGLNLLLKPYDCTYLSKDEVVLIVSKEEAFLQQELRIYDCQELVAKIGEDPEQSRAKLVTVVAATVEPKTWVSAGGEGTISEIGGKLIVSQNRYAHLQIGSLLSSLDREFSK